MSDERKEEYTETVSVRLTQAQAERLRAHANEKQASVSDVIREWIDAGFSDNQRFTGEGIYRYL